MTDLFRSAFNYLSSATAPVGAGGATGRADHELVGTYVEVGGLKLRIRSLLAEGGYALVFAATDAQGQWYALKRQLAADRAAADDIIREIRFLRQLTGHPSIIRYVQAAQLSPQESGHGRAEFLLLTELCSGGPVVVTLQKRALDPEQVLKIFYAACAAVKHMHEQNPPIIHRDLKIENLLFDSRGFVKLCDFGSATTDIFQPDDSWTANKRSQLEDDMARYTTPMYRAPEMLDTYLNYPIGPALDVWALGCILQYLCYRVHPFEDSAKLRILNAKYTLPEEETPFTVFHPLIRTALQIDPRARPSVAELCERTEVLAVALSVDLRSPVRGLDLPGVPAAQPDSSLNQAPSPARNPTQQAPPPRPPPPTSQQSGMDHHGHAGSSAPSAGAVFGALKGQGLSIFKNLKDTSAKVVQTVQATYGGKGPAFTYITSRLAIAPFAEGVPEALAAPAEEALRGFLEQRRGHFAVYNVGQRRLRCDYGGRLSEVPFPTQESGRPPTLNALFLLCKNMTLWLRQDARNFCVITGPETHCATVAVSFLLFTRLVPKPLSAMELIKVRRSQIKLPPSFHRLLDLVTSIGQSPEPPRLHKHAVTIESVRIEPTPLFNRAKSGCRPFVEVWNGDHRTMSTAMEYEQIRPFELPESRFVEIPLGVTVSGDVSVSVYHARWVRVQGKMQSIPMVRVSFHSMFADPTCRTIEFLRGDIDDMDEDWKYPEPFRVVLNVRFADSERPFDGEPPSFWNYDSKSVSPRLAVADKEERDTIIRMLGLKRPQDDMDDISPAHQAPPPMQQQQQQQQQKQQQQQSTAGFFSTLEWQAGEDHGRSHPAMPSSTSRDASASPSLGRQQQQPQQSAAAAQMTKRQMQAEDYERMYGIRVGGGPVDESSDHMFDCDRPDDYREQESNTAALIEEADLLNLGPSGGSAAANGQPTHQANTFDPFAHFESKQPHKSASANLITPTNGGDQGDLLNDWLNSSAPQPIPTAPNLHPPNMGMHRNVSAPSFAQPNNGGARPQFDPFSNLMSSQPATGSWQQPMGGGFPPQAMGGQQTAWRPNAPMAGGAGLPPRPTGPMGSNSGSATPTFQHRPNYSRSNFETNNPFGGVKPKVKEDAFDDLLSSQGFSATTRIQANQSLGELKRVEEIRDMDPVSIRIRDWTKGKERNIRALLGSLKDVLWDGADKWDQPNISQLYTATEVKKCYRRACLVVHPDKQTGTPNEALARAIFTELNDAWNDFESAGSPSL